MSGLPWWFWLLLGWNVILTVKVELLHLTTPTIRPRLRSKP